MNCSSHKARKLQIDLGKKYDMKRNEAGKWTCTTEPLTRGFHYYFLIVDGVSVADPAGLSMGGIQTLNAGIRPP